MLVVSACGVSRSASLDAVAFSLESGSADELSAVEVTSESIEPVVDEVLASPRFINLAYGAVPPEDIRADVATRVLYEEVLDLELAKVGIDPDTVDTTDAQANFALQLAGALATEADPEAAAIEVGEEVSGYLDLLARLVSKQTALGEALLGDQGEPGTIEVPCASHILVATAEEADDVLAQLEDGGDFAALAMELSLDTGSGAAGGVLGCADPEQFVVEFRDAVISAPVGEIVGPVETQFGFHIIVVDEIQEQPEPVIDPATAAAPIVEAALRDLVVISGPGLEGYQWDPTVLAIVALDGATG